MKKIPLGTTVITLSRMGLGTWAIAAVLHGMAISIDKYVLIRFLKPIVAGINLIDTAAGYNFGNSEVIVGQALKKRPVNRL